MNNRPSSAELSEIARLARLGWGPQEIVSRLGFNVRYEAVMEAVNYVRSLYDRKAAELDAKTDGSPTDADVIRFEAEEFAPTVPKAESFT